MDSVRRFKIEMLCVKNNMKEGNSKHRYGCLVGGFKHDFYFPFHIWDVILPIDELHHFSEGYTTNQYIIPLLSHYYPY